MAEILSLSNLPKRNLQKILSNMYDGDVKDEPKKTIMTLANMPPRGRVREPVIMRMQGAGQAGKTNKILTLSDLPKRGSIAARIAAEVRKMKVEGQRQIALRERTPKIFSDYVKNGMWKGRRCFIIGGGPSVRDLDLSALSGELTIGINRAYELLSPSILYGVDPQMWGWVEQGKCGEESKRKFNDYKGYKVWMALTKAFPPDFYLIDVDDGGGYKIGSTNRMAFKNNSGYGAVNLAAALGANPIYLIGFDMKGDKQGKQTWWHDGYPVDYGENIYKGYITEFGKFAPELKERGFDVVNLNPKSGLKCFEFGDYNKVVRNRPVIPANAIRVMGQPGMITAITPTGDRPLAFALCAHWMETQTVRPD